MTANTTQTIISAPACGALPLTGALRFTRSDGSAIRFSKGRGGIVYDTRGRPYWDFVLGMGPISIGHASPEFNDRMRHALDQGLMFPGFAEIHEQYCSHLQKSSPGAQVIAFFKTGSETVSAALRIAAIHTGRMGVIRCGYTGWHDAQLASSPRWNEPLTSPFRAQLQFDYNYRGVGDIEPVANWWDFKLSSLERLISDRFGVLVLDTYQLSFGSMDSALDGIQLCRDHGMVIVLDETKTAGRRGSSSAFFDTRLRGDLSVLGKAIANGFPLSVLLQHRSFDSEIRSTRVAGTFSKDALAVHAALATAELMEEWNGYATLGRTGTQVVTTLNGAARNCGVDEYVTAIPLLDGQLFEFRYSKRIEADAGARQQLEQCFIDAGILLFQGHCSFVCHDHQKLDWNAFSESVNRALTAWRGSLHQ
jgi:glutamate-1-semialdehyde 2,1-aminomutase